MSCNQQGKIMKLFKHIVVTLALSISINVGAKTVDDVEIYEAKSFNDKTLIEQGAGVRSKFFIDLYVASFFNEEKVNNKAVRATDSQEVLNSQNLSAIRLNIISGLITSEKMLDSIEQGFDLATDGDSQEIDVYIAEFISIFDQPIKKQDQFTFISEPGVGVHVLKNNQRLTSINNDAFRQALLSIWLGTSPVDNELKREMLGN